MTPLTRSLRAARTGLVVLALSVVLCAPGCAALQQFSALRQVQFEFDRVSDVRVAGVLVSGRSGYGDLGATDIARLGAAVLSKSVPLDMTLHVRGTNPASNTVTARMVALGWTFFVEDRDIVAGRLDQAYAFAPGQAVDVPVAVHFNAYDRFGGGAKSLFELGLAIAGAPGYTKELRADLVPTIETSLGPIRYPTPITIRRTIGG
ncbi:MAG: hypothetical protein ABI960_10495 [Candidatus Eisenbacteria bacterium]